MRNELVNLASKPLRALRSGRYWLSPLVAQISPRQAQIMAAHRFEEEGRLDEALAVWKGLEGTRTHRSATFRLLLRRARQALHQGHWDKAIEDFRALIEIDPHDVRVTRGLESAALRGARHAQSSGQWLEACRMWAVYGRGGSDLEKCLKNLGDCARYVAQSADSVEKMANALEAWGLLKSVDLYSQEAEQGMEWCHLSLARAAERASDPVTARDHWNALLALSPGDQRAIDGLKRLDAAGS